MKVLKFGAVWCPGCLVMKPRWQEVETENPWLETEYFEFDEHKDLAAKYDIEKLPAFIFLDKQNKELTRLIGEPSKKEIINLINQYRNQ